MNDAIADLLGRYEELDYGGSDVVDGRAISGWQCANFYADELIQAAARRASEMDHVSYCYLEDDALLSSNLLELHTKLDRRDPGAVFCGAGANSLLYTFIALLRRRGIEEVYYIPPLYFSGHFALSQFGIRARPVSSRQAFEDSFEMNLPDKETVLLITDPIWYVGLQIPPAIIDRIAQWQRRTHSIILVDGSFQYMPWAEPPFERTAHLDSLSTFRIVSPTKILAVHGYRFAYVLLPKAFRSEFASTYSQVYGSSNVASIAFAHEAIPYLHDRSITKALMKIAAERHGILRSRGILESALNPDCGYFVFEKLKVELPPGHYVMGGELFEQRRFSGYVRINLLSPVISLILNE